MSERKRKRREWLDYLSATQAETPQRTNPFLCSWCGAQASERHYDPATSEHVASFCPTHTPDIESMTAITL